MSPPPLLKWVTLRHSLLTSFPSRDLNPLDPHPCSSRITRLWTWDEWKGGLFFFSPSQVFWYEMISRSCPKFLSVLGLRSKSPFFFNWFEASRCSSCIFFLICWCRRCLKGCWWREVKTWKTDDVGLLLVGYVFFPCSLWILALFFLVFWREVFCVLFFFVIVDVSLRRWKWEGAGL